VTGGGYRVWNAKLGRCEEVAVDPYQAWLEKPAFEPPPADASPVGRAIDRIRIALAQLRSSPEGRTYARLAADPDYARLHDAGFADGFSAGSDTAVELWYREYADLADKLWNALLKLTRSQLNVGDEFWAAVKAVYQGGQETSEVVSDPQFVDLRNELKLALPIVAGVDVLLRGRTAAQVLDDPAWQALKAFITKDPRVEELRDLVETLEWLKPILDTLLTQLTSASLLQLLGGMELTVAEWIQEFGNYLVEVFDEVYMNNCSPETQGYYVGWRVGEIVVNTLRFAVEDQYQLVFLEFGISSLARSATVRE